MKQDQLELQLDEINDKLTALSEALKYLPTKGELKALQAEVNQFSNQVQAIRAAPSAAGHRSCERSGPERSSDRKTPIREHPEAAVGQLPSAVSGRRRADDSGSKDIRHQS